MNEVEVVVTERRTGDAFGSLTRDINRARQDFKQLRSDAKIDPQIDTKVQVDTSEVGSARREIEDIDNTQVKVKTDVETPDASGAVSSVEAQFADVDLSDMGGAMQSQLGSMLGGPIAGIFGTAAATLGGDFADGVAQGIRARSTTIEESIRFGVANAEVRQVGEISGAAYSDGFGEGAAQLRDVALTLRAELGAIDDDLDLSQATRQVSVLSDVFQIDLAQSVNLARRLVANDLVADTSEAFNLMVDAAQKYRLNVDEVFDVMSEFAPVFSKMGVDGATAMNIIGTAAQQGLLPNISRGAELFEEFNVRLAEVDTLRAPVQALGLDFDVMQQKLADGRGAEALAEIAEALLAIEDPAKRDAIAVEIFGTAIESAADPQAVINLLATADSITAVGTAADDAAAQLQGAQTGIDKLKIAAEEGGRAWGDWVNIQGSFVTSLVESKGNLREFADAWAESTGRTKEATTEIEGVTSALTRAEGPISGGGRSLRDLGESADDVATGMESLEARTERLQGALQSLSDWASGSGEAALRGIHEAADGITEAFGENEAAAFSLKNGWDLTTEAGRAGSSMMADLRNDVAAVTQAYINGEVTTAQYASATSALEGRLREAAAAAGIDKAAVDALAGSLFALPSDVQTQVDTHTEQAQANIAAMDGMLSAINGRTANTFINNTTTNTVINRTIGGRRPSRIQAHGGVTGAVPTAESGGVRNGLTLVGEAGPELVELPAGAMVRTADDTERAMNQIRGDGGTTNIFNIAGSVWSTRDLEELMRDLFLGGAFGNLGALAA